MKRKILALLLCLQLIVSLCACQGASAADTTSPAETFQNLSGSVTFSFSVGSNSLMETPSVVEVTPHQLTGSDAKTAANALFGNVQFYEDPDDEVLSKREIEQRLARWEQYSSIEALTEVYGSAEAASVSREIVNGFLERYGKMAETAAETVERTPCQWTFYPASHYWYASMQEAAATSTEIPNNEIKAAAVVNGIPYQLYLSSRDEDDFKIQNISAYIDPGVNPGNLDLFIYMRQLCGHVAPTAEQLMQAKSRASAMLADMQLGSWEIDSCYSEPAFDENDNVYRIMVTAVPMLDGKAALRQHQLGNLRSTDESASNYYYTDAAFEFAPNGALISCHITSPIDILSTEATDVKLIDMAQLHQIAKEELAKDGYQKYAHNVLVTGNSYKCTVQVTDAELGMTRIKGADDNTYYYVPAVVYRGSYQAYEAQSGELHFDSDEWWNGEAQTLIVLNALDGSVINTVNPEP